jgi:two-component system response regulator AtoC
MHILIVDDEALQRNLLGGYLKKQGFSVVEAASGLEAIDRFLQHPIDLVLLDQRMPDLQGDQVLERIKAINPLARVIMITAFGAVDTAVKVMQLGADDFLEKPIDLEALLIKIRAIEERLYITEDVAQVEASIEVESLPVRMIAASPAM